MNRRFSAFVFSGILLTCISFVASGCSRLEYAEVEKDFITCQEFDNWAKEAAGTISELPEQASYGGGEDAGKISSEAEEYTGQMSSDPGNAQNQRLDNGEFVKVEDYIPDIQIDLKYATAENFTGNVIYDFNEAYLRYGTVKKLMKVQDEVKQSGYSLKIWDAFRPAAAQFKLWQICPDSRYVANPNTGFSSHSKGNTVDITLVNRDGEEIELPTGFDDFSSKADRDYSDCSTTAAENARYLENVMQKNGFVPYAGEWWHFSDEDSYPVEEMFLS